MGTKVDDFSTSCISYCIDGGTFYYCVYTTRQYKIYALCNGTDADGDGHYTLDSCKTPNDDCEDDDASIYPGAEEQCDCKDNNCDGTKDEGCCPEIIDFKGNNTVINLSTGGSIRFTGTIQSVCDKPVSWTVSVPGKTFTGSGTSVSVTWDGKNASGKVVKPGTYTAALSVTANDCTVTKSKSFTIKDLKNCNLKVTFKSSANIASGNLSHSQEFFGTQGGTLPASITLHYNSLDPYAGPLGMGWIHTYDIAVSESQDGSVVLRDGAGGYRLYTQSAAGYSSQPGDYSVLTKDADGIYTITHKDGRKYTFGTDGKITAMIDRNGNAITFAYTDGNLTTITDPAGRTTSLSYNTDGTIAEISDPAGNIHSFTYGSGTLADISTQNSELGTLNWHYTYDDNAFMLTKTDPEGNTTTYTYDEDHRIISGTSPESTTKTITYSTGTTTTQVTEGDSSLWTYAYDTQQGVLTQKTDPDGNATTYTYDQNRNMLFQIDPDGSTTTYTYDQQGNTATITDALGQTTTYEYNDYSQVTSTIDAEGNTSTNTYDETGNLTSATDATGSTTTYAYDTKGNLVTITNALGQSTTYNYDDQNNLTTITGPTGQSTSFTYDAAGNRTSQTNADGNTTTFEYNSLGQLVKVIDPLGNSTTYTYDKNGNRTSQTDANGNTTTYTYNSQGRIITTTDPIGNTTTYTYGSAGCSTCSSGGDKLIAIADAKGNTITYEYDTIGRRTKQTDPLGNQTTYTYDAKGNLLTTTDANGHVTAYAYDGLSRITQQTDPLEGAIQYTYTPKGQITGVIDPAGHTTTYEYDAAGRIIKTESPDTGTTTYTYDTLGNLATKSDAQGATITYSYDTLNRLKTIDFPTDTDITYTYDDCPHGAGRVCTITDPSGATAYTYDQLGRITTETKTILGVAYTTSYSYDNIGKTTTITYPSGRIVTYTYDKVNRPTNVTAKLRTPTTLASRFQYDQTSNLTQLTLGSGLTPAWTYDANNRIATITVPNIQGLSYAYDPVGNITAITNNLDATASKTYTYDPLSRLSTATGPWGSLAWTYDATGNRQTQTDGASTDTYAYQTGTNKLTGLTTGGTTFPFTYDNNGNTDSELRTENSELRTFVYNQNQRLIQVTQNNKTLGQYTHNAQGQRVIKKTGPASTNSASSQNIVYHYDQAGRLIEETTAKGKLITDYVYLNNTPLAMIRKQSNNEETFYYHTDHLGTPKIMTDKLQKVVWNIEFDPFGNEISRKGRKGDYIRSVTNNLRFPGQYFDEETGLHYNYFRDYNPVIGRYVQADPIGLAGGMNLYAYVTNNPLNLVDPMGLAGGGLGFYYVFGGEASYSSSTCCENNAKYNVKILTVCGGVGIGVKGTPPVGITVGGISSRSGCPRTRYYFKHETVFLYRSVNVQGDSQGPSAGIDAGIYGISTAWVFCSDTVLSKKKVGCCSD